MINVGAGVETPVVEVGRALLQLMDLPADWMHVVARRPWDRVVRRVADVRRLRERYGAVPSTPLEVGLPETVRWLREAGYLRRR